MSEVDGEAAEVVNIISVAEGGGLGGSRVLPSAWLEETMYFHNARVIVLKERNRIERYREAHKREGG